VGIHLGAAWDYCVTCHPTRVSAPRLHPSHAGRCSIYLPRRDGRLSCWRCVCVLSCRAVLTRVRVTVAHYITGTVDVAPASRWESVNVNAPVISAPPTPTPSVAALCPAVNSPATRPSTSAVACKDITATESSRTARLRHPLSPYSLPHGTSCAAWLATTRIRLCIAEIITTRHVTVLKCDEAPDLWLRLSVFLRLVSNNDKKAQLTQRERATAVHV